MRSCISRPNQHSPVIIKECWNWCRCLLKPNMGTLHQHHTSFYVLSLFLKNEGNERKEVKVYEEINVYEMNVKKRFELTTRNHKNDVVKMQRRKKNKSFEMTTRNHTNGVGKMQRRKKNKSFEMTTRNHTNGVGKMQRRKKNKSFEMTTRNHTNGIVKMQRRKKNKSFEITTRNHTNGIVKLHKAV